MPKCDLTSLEVSFHWIAPIKAQSCDMVLIGRENNRRSTQSTAQYPVCWIGNQIEVFSNMNSLGQRTKNEIMSNTQDGPSMAYVKERSPAGYPS